MMREQTDNWRQERYLVQQGPPGPPPEQPDIAVSIVGRLQSVSGFRYEQVSAQYSLHLVEEGRGCFEIDGTRWPARRGTVCLFHPGSLIRYHDEAGARWRYYWCFGDGRQVAWAMGLTGLSREAPVRHDVDARLFPHFRELLEHLRDGTLAPHASVAWMWRTIDLLADTAAGAGTPDLARACRALIDSEYDQALTVDELAARLHVERSTLFRHFRDAYDLSPKAYMDLLRVQKAQTLLRDPARTVRQIAAACGYSDPNYFSRRFRQVTGRSPSAWRASP